MTNPSSTTVPSSPLFHPPHSNIKWQVWKVRRANSEVQGGASRWCGLSSLLQPLERPNLRSDSDDMMDTDISPLSSESPNHHHNNNTNYLYTSHSHRNLHHDVTIIHSEPGTYPLPPNTTPTSPTEGQPYAQQIQSPNAHQLTHINGILNPMIQGGFMNGYSGYGVISHASIGPLLNVGYVTPHGSTVDQQQLHQPERLHQPLQQSHQQLQHQQLQHQLSQHQLSHQHQPLPHHPSVHQDQLQPAPQHVQPQDRQLQDQQQPQRQQQHNRQHADLNRDSFEIFERLGTGAFSQIYRATHAEFGDVAIKVVDRVAEFPAGNNLEFDISRELHHPNIIHCFGRYFADNCMHIVFELANEGDLFDRLEAQELDEHQCRSLMVQAAEAITYIHSRNYVHFDIKLENMLLHNGALKLCDFGLSGVNGSVRVGKPHGTSAYMPCELACIPEGNTRYEVSFAADVWAFAIVLHTVIFADLPWEKAVIHDDEYDEFRLEDDPESMQPWCLLHQQLRNTIVRMLHASPTQRPTMIEVTAAVRGPWLNDGDVMLTDDDDDT